MKMGTLLIIFLASTIYAVALQSDVGQRLAARRGWIAGAIVGVIALAGLVVLLPWADWLVVVAVFLLAGVPLAVRGVVNELRGEHEAMEIFRRDDEA